MLIGIDFDNTIAAYDALFVDAARRLFGLVMMVPPTGGGSAKTAIRDALRAEAGGEQRWQALQAEVYGRRMAEAEPMPGVEAFLQAACERGLSVRIISHKTRHAAADPGGVDLHRASLDWLEARGLLDTRRTGLDRGHVHFEQTRGAKILRIAETGCTHFIDDLREVLTDPTFPRGVRRYLFGHTADIDGLCAPKSLAGTGSGAIRAFASWHEISDDILHRRAA